MSNVPDGVAILNRQVLEGITKKISFILRPEAGKGYYHVDICD